MSAAHPLDPPPPPSADEGAMADSGDFLKGIAETALSLERSGLLRRSPDRDARYGDDRAREIADLEAGRHPRALRR